MVMERITLFGAKPLSVRIAKFLHDRPDFDLAAIVTSPKEEAVQDRETLAGFARRHGIPHCYGRDLTRPFDGRGVSIGYPHILPRAMIDLYSHGVMNLHFGELPYYRGTGTPSFAILNSEPFFGVTLHEIDEGIDTGPVYGVAKFAIPPAATAADITAECEDLGFALFCSLIKGICAGYMMPIPQDSMLSRRRDGRRTALYRSSDLARYSPVDLARDRDELLRQLRALTLTGQGPMVLGHDRVARDLSSIDAARLIGLLIGGEGGLH
jgi:methionyl-tRNA formyltransferase